MFNFFNRNRIDFEAKLFYKTDIHSHICPGIDDGSRSTMQSLKLVEGMSGLGIEKMIVTPHVTDEVFPNNAETIRDSFGKLSKLVEKSGIPMQLDYSAEYRIDELLQHQLENNAVLPLEGGYLLVECAWMQEPFSLDSFLFNLQNRFGLKPILAHPERYPYYHTNYVRYKELHDKGVMFQINLLSLAGHYGKACKTTAEWLLNNNLIDLVGSDLHRSDHIESIRRYISSKDYQKLLDKRHLVKNDILWPLS